MLHIGLPRRSFGGRGVRAVRADYGCVAFAHGVRITTTPFMWTLWLSAVPYGLRSEEIRGSSMKEHAQWPGPVERVLEDALNHFGVSLRKGTTVSSRAHNWSGRSRYKRDFPQRAVSQRRPHLVPLSPAKTRTKKFGTMMSATKTGRTTSPP